MLSLLDVLLQITRVLDELGVVYAVVGSFASSAYGFPRATNDVDLVAGIEPSHVPQLVAALQDSFYIDEVAVRRAVEGHRSFNAIHFVTAFKIDFFIPRGGGFGQQQLTRRRAGGEIYLASAEDTVLAKLRWFKKGGEISERQWSDVIGVIKVQKGNLDLEYMRTWADSLDVAGLLERALEEAASD